MRLALTAVLLLAGGAEVGAVSPRDIAMPTLPAMHGPTPAPAPISHSTGSMGQAVPRAVTPSALAPAGRFGRAEAVAAAFGPGVKTSGKGRFTWAIPRDQPLPWDANEGIGDVRGKRVQARVLRFEPLPAAPGQPARWLLVTAGPTASDGQTDDCHACGAVVSAFVLARAPTGEITREAAAPLLAQLGSFGGPPAVTVVATGPERRALRLESGFTGQGYTGTYDNFYAVAPGFPNLLTKTLPVHADNEGICDKSAAARAKDPALKACATTDTAVRFVPAKPGESDDPGQWVLEATTRGDRDESMLPPGVTRLAFRGGKYQVPASATGP